MTYHVYPIYQTWTSREIDPDDSWDYGDTEGHATGAGIATRDYDHHYNGMNTGLEPPFYAVYAGYETGSTFGRDFEACIVGVVKTQEEAEALLDEAQNFKSFGSLGNGFYVPWNGYFERLQSLDIERLA